MSKNGKRRTSKKLTPEEEQDVIESMQADLDKEKVNALQNVSINIKCKTENQKKFINLIKEKEIVIAAGTAGTGKTFLSCAEALKLMKLHPEKYKKIILIKSVTTLQGEDIGYLKGDLETKMMPFMFSFKNNLYKIIGKGLADSLEASGIIEVLPLAFIRGINLDNCIILVDEAQNISKDNMKTIMTRIGEDSKMIIIGDTKQVDLKYEKKSSLLAIMEKFKDRPEFGTMYFEKSDQVRNPIINLIEDAFDEMS